MSITTIALSGISSAEGGAARAASGIAASTWAASSSRTDLSRDLVDLQQSADSVAIDAKVVEAGQKLTTALLDLFA